MNPQNDVIEIDLKDLFFAVLKRWWLIALCMLLAGGTAYGVSKFYLTPVYRAETSLFLGKEGSDITLDWGIMETNNQLINDYGEIVKSRMVSREVLQTLGVDMDLADFQSRIGVNIIMDSRLFSLSFESTNPQLARDVANQLAQVIIEKAAEIIGVKNVQVIDAAELPTSPVSPNTMKNTAMGLAIGLMAALGIIFLLEMLDQTFKKADDLERRAGFPVLASIPVFKGEVRDDLTPRARRRKKKSERPSTLAMSQNLIAHHDPKAPASEAYRALRTNLHYAGIDREIRSLVVTSPTAADGKTTTAANLAISMAQNGKRVLLVDADLRKPKIHRYFGITNGTGLTHLLVQDAALSDAVVPAPGIGHLFLVTSGSTPPNPSELISSERMRRLIQEMAAQYDLVILDTPPAAQVTDSVQLAGETDGTLMVVSAGETHIDRTLQAVKALKAVNAKLLGEVLVKTEHKGKGYYYYYA